MTTTQGAEMQTEKLRYQASSTGTVHRAFVIVSKVDGRVLDVRPVCQGNRPMAGSPVETDLVTCQKCGTGLSFVSVSPHI